MRVLQPKEGQTFLYFYEDYELNPSQNITAARKLLKEIGCKIGPPWMREQPEYYICSCESGEFRLVNDVPAIYVESDSSQVIKYLAEGLMVVCHRYKVGDEVRLIDGRSAKVTEYINEDYAVAVGEVYFQITEKEILCKKMIPDNIEGKDIVVTLIDPDFGEFYEYEGVVVAKEMINGSMGITIEVEADWDIDENEEMMTFEKTILEGEIKTIRIV